MENFLKSYQDKLKHLIDQIDLETINKVINLISNTNKHNSNIYVIGNGGSAATASHMVNDLGVGLSRRGLENFNIQSLSDNIAVCSALANDVGYENIFYEQLKNRISSNDLLIAISCSGNSSNIIKAVEYAKTKNCTIISFTGFDGGKLKGLSDINLHIQTNKNEYGLVEDLHMIFNHMIYSYFIQKERN